uniref:Putative secreted protein n=1 Tax=Ixodes ricinus TaxID=34613 RepID=A0A6B0UV71_IXORI
MASLSSLAIRTLLCSGSTMSTMSGSSSFTLAMTPVRCLSKPYFRVLPCSRDASSSAVHGVCSTCQSNSSSGASPAVKPASSFPTTSIRGVEVDGFGFGARSFVKRSRPVKTSPGYCLGMLMTKVPLSVSYFADSFPFSITFPGRFNLR